MNTKESIFRRILCATDFSEPSQRALEHAAALARWSGARLSVMHAVAPPDFRLVGAMPMGEPERERRLDVLRRFVAPAIEPSAARLVLRSGEVGAEVAAEAAGWAADLVVVGTHGRRGLDRWELGSVAEQVIRTSPAPVLAVPPGAAPVAGGEEPPFRRVLCALDLGPSSSVTLEHALSMALRGKAAITVLHVLEDLPESGSRMQLRLGAQWFAAYRESVENKAREQLRELLPEEVRAACEVDERLVPGSPHRRIVGFARQWPADLVVIGAQGGRSLSLAVFGSTTARVLREASCPVLTVPGRATARVPERAGRLALLATQS